MALAKYFRGEQDMHGKQGMMPSDTPQPAEEKMGARMAKGMPKPAKKKSFGQRIAQRESC